VTIALNDFISILKRVGHYGSPAVITDQATTDILNAVNVRGARIWGAADWKWQREVLAFGVTPGTTQYGVTAKSGNPIDRILDIIPVDKTVSPSISAAPLEQMEIGDFYLKCSQVNVIPDIPQKYINIGQDANGIWQIIIWPSPSSAFTMSGYAKAVLYTYLQSDVVANTAIKYFPNGVILDALMAGCLIDIGRIQGMSPETALGAESAWESKIKHLIGEQIGVASDNSPKTAPMPDRIVRRMMNRNRRGTSVR
jgi:hypothetical protein